MPRRSEDQVLFDVGRRVAELRETGALTQQNLADAVGLSPQRVREIEAGTHNPSVRTLDRIAKGLAVEIAALFEVPASRARRGPGRPPKATPPPPTVEKPRPTARQPAKPRA